MLTPITAKFTAVRAGGRVGKSRAKQIFGQSYSCLASFVILLELTPDRSFCGNRRFDIFAQNFGVCRTREGDHQAGIVTHAI